MRVQQKPQIVPLYRFCPMTGLLSRWTAVLLAQLVVANGRRNESVHHQVCCVQMSYRPKFGSSGIVAEEWAELLDDIIDWRADGDPKPGKCVHEFGIGGSDPTIGGAEAYIPQEADYHESYFHYNVDTNMPPDPRFTPKKYGAHCATVSLHMSDVAKPLETYIDFFTPDLLDEITRRRPSIRIQHAFVELVFENGRWERREKEKKESAWMDYEDGYSAEKKAPEYGRVPWSTKFVLDSTQIADTFPQQGSRRRRSREKGDDSEAKESRSRSRSRKGDRELSPRQITDFLLVNSLLAVSNTKYSDFMRIGALRRLRRSESPIFAACAENITREPQQTPTPGSSSADWLLSNFRFTMTGSRHTSFGYRKLYEVNPKDFSQCAVLALVGVGRQGFKDLTRQSFDMIFGILTRKQMETQSSVYEKYHTADKLTSVSAASGVDPWKLLPENYSSSLTLGQVFKKISLRIQENGPTERPVGKYTEGATPNDMQRDSPQNLSTRLSSSERGRSGRRSVSKAKSSPETQEAVKSAMQFIE